VNRKIFKLDNNGILLLSFGGKGEGEGQFNRPWAFDVDSDNNIHVSERNNYGFKNLIQMATLLHGVGMMKERENLVTTMLYQLILR
jgi:hypothetical protein